MLSDLGSQQGYRGGHFVRDDRGRRALLLLLPPLALTLLLRIASAKSIDFMVAECAQPGSMSDLVFRRLVPELRTQW